LDNSFASPFGLLDGVFVKEAIMSAIHALLIFATLTAPAVASAATPVPQSMAIGAGDLDLSSDKGQRILAQRIQRAAKAMCKAEALENLPRHIRATRKCIREAQAGTKAAVKTLTDAQHARQGRDG
jgi:UrcA family protein